MHEGIIKPFREGFVGGFVLFWRVMSVLGSAVVALFLTAAAYAHGKDVQVRVTTEPAEPHHLGAKGPRSA